MKTLRRKIEIAKMSYKALYTLLKEETSFRSLVIAGGVAISFAFLFNINGTDFNIVLLVVGTVLAVEALNSAIEELCDHVTPEHHYRIGKIKDISSGASGIINIAALIIGCNIFIPYLLML